MKTPAGLGHLLLIGVLLSGGCAVDPPVRLEAQLRLAEALEVDGSAWEPPPIAVAPVALSFAEKSDAYWGPEDQETLAGIFGAAQGEDREATGPAGDDGEAKDAAAELEGTTWSDPPVEAGPFQRRLAELLRWSLHPAGLDAPEEYFPPLGPLTLKDASEETASPSGVVAEEAQASARRRDRRAQACLRADEAVADFVLLAEITRHRTIWRQPDWLLWSADIFLFWTCGLFPAIFIPDEVFEVDLSLRLTLLHARSEEPVWGTELAGREVRALNDAQHGWTVSGFFWLSRWVSDPGPDDYGQAHAALWPWAKQDLERQLVETLRRELPEVLERPKQRELRQGRPSVFPPERARTYAVLAAADNPRLSEAQLALPASEGPPPLTFAEGDARAFQDTLVSSGLIAHRELHTRLVGPTSGRSLAGSVAELGERLLAVDQLIVYFAGYGTTDADGQPLLVGPSGPESLKELADTVAALPNDPRVLFILDTSFAPGRPTWSRSFRWKGADPGGPAPPGDYLDILADPQRGWIALAACEAHQWAFEDDHRQHGLLTDHLLQALGDATKADVDGDGLVRSSELASVLEGVAEYADRYLRAFQTPKLRTGTDRDPVVFRLERPGG